MSHKTLVRVAGRRRRPLLARPGRRRTSYDAAAAAVNALLLGRRWRSSWSPWSGSARDWCPARPWLRLIVGLCLPLLVWSIVSSPARRGVGQRRRRRVRAAAGARSARPALLGGAAKDDARAAPRRRARQVAASLAGYRESWPGPRCWVSEDSRRRAVDGRHAMGHRIRRMAMISLHTSPLDQPGTGDAGGMNVYVIELAKRLVRARPRGRHLHPRDELGARAAVEPGRRDHGAAHPRRPVRGADQGGAARPAVRVRARGAARRGGPARRALRRRALPLLALRPGRRAGPRPLGRAAGALACTRWRRSRTTRSPTATPPSRRPGSSARSRWSRPPTC